MIVYIIFWVPRQADQCVQWKKDVCIMLVVLGNFVNWYQERKLLWPMHLIEPIAVSVQKSVVLITPRIGRAAGS